MSLICYFLGLVLTQAVMFAGAEKRRWCMYTNWAQYRGGKGRFVPEYIDASLCTHISYAFATIKNGELAQFEWNDDDMYTRVNSLKTTHKGLKTTLAVGGWNLGSMPFVNVVVTQSARSHFISGAIQFLRSNDFDGIDICWQYPTSRGSTEDDKPNFAMLLKEMRTAFDLEGQATHRDPLLIGVFVGAEEKLIDRAYDIEALNNSADAVSLLTYDFYTPGTSKYAAHASALYAGSKAVGIDRQKSLEWVANYWASLGLSKHLINVGITFYGHSYTLDDSSNHNEGSHTSKAGKAGKYTKLDGFLSYYEVCQLFDTSSVYYLNEKNVSYLVNGNQWIGYEDVNSVALKAKFILDNDFGGAMMWSFDVDDFKGICQSQSVYPLMKSVKNALLGGKIEPHPSATSHTDVCKGKSNGSYPDPSSCHFFYICANGSQMRFPCSNSELFDKNTHQCVASHLAKCS